jgi:methyl acetate hydrolase
MTRLIVLPIAVLTIALGSCSTARDKAELDRVLTSAVKRKLVPGVVAMIATEDGPVYQGFTGFSRDAIFAIASMTKPVTSVAVMQLVEAGKVKLDEPASTYIPELASFRVMENGKLRPPKSPITVRHLLTHTSGFGYEFMNRQLFDAVGQGKLKSIMAGGADFLIAPLLFDPGTKWEYGINTDWLGRLVERLSGESLETYFKRQIFDPLGMTDSFFVVPAEKQARVATRYQRKEDGSLAAVPAQSLNSPGFLSGGGGLYSTAADYLRFSQALMNGGQLGTNRILKAESVDAMGRNQIGELAIRPFTSYVPSFATDGAALPGGLDKFGLGFALNTKPTDSGRAPNTMAWAGIFNTFFWIDREKKICAVVMSQMSPGLDDGPRQLLEDFDRAAYRWLNRN